MTGWLPALPWLFAQKAASGSDSSLPTIVMLAPVLVFVYILILRPQQQQEKKRKQMIAALKKNDRVLTAAGIYGTVMSIDDEGNRVLLRVDDDKGVRLAFSKESIFKVIESPSEKSGDAG